MIGQDDPNYHLKPHLLFMVTLGSIFCVELLVMFFLSFMPWLSTPVEAFLDACLLSILVVPVLYFFFLRPLYKNIEKGKQEEIARYKLQKIDDLKSEFISTAAHELRTPVATIMGFTEFLSDQEVIGPLSEAQKRDFLREIYENSKRLNKIVDDILDVRRIESGDRIALNKETLFLERLLEKIVTRLRFKASHNIVLDIRSGGPKILDLDEYRIDQVMENLLGNAFKYSPEQSTITIVAESDGKHCHVTISDQGIGMTKEQQARIFDKFYRADTSDTAVRGLGLGMGIVKQIIEDHNGKIRIDSQLGVGTSVCFSLPTGRSTEINSIKTA